jgi:Ca2+/Na+ antiporter
MNGDLEKQMRYCSNCGKPLNGNPYCPACKSFQPAEEVSDKIIVKTPAIVITLAVITMLGSASGIVRGLLYQTTANLFKTGALHNQDYSRGYVLMLLNFGTFMAAIFMLRLKPWSYYMYLIFQLAYIVFTFYISFIYSTDVKSRNIADGLNPIVLVLSSVFWLPSIILLTLYLTLARKHFSNGER